MTYEDMLKEFHTAFGLPLSEEPRMPLHEISALRMKLLNEEFSEYRMAENERNLVEIADALADIVYVAIGTAVAYGIPFDEVFREVHKSNMSKLDGSGRAVYREDGKVLKSSSFEPPNLVDIIFK